MFLTVIAFILIIGLCVLYGAFDSMDRKISSVGILLLMIGIVLSVVSSPMWFVLGIIVCVFLIYIDYYIENQAIKSNREYRYKNYTPYSSTHSSSKSQETVSVSKPKDITSKSEVYYGPNGNEYKYIGGGMVIDPGGHVINGVPNGTYTIETENGQLRKKQM